MPSLLERLGGLVAPWTSHDPDARQLVMIPPDRTDNGAGTTTAAAGEHYVRLLLSDCGLSHDREWFRRMLPGLTSTLTTTYGDSGPVTLSKIIEPPDSTFGPTVRMNLALTDLVPFRGGALDVNIALVKMPRTDHLAKLIDTIGAFSDLVTAPLGPALGVARTVSDSIADLLGAAEGVALAWRQGYTGSAAAPLTDAYVAVVDAPPTRVPPASLHVVKGRLRTTNGAALAGIDHLLARVELTEGRADWGMLSDIETPMRKATEVIGAMEANHREKAEQFMRAAMVAAFNSPDLTRTDRNRVAADIRETVVERLRLLSGGLGATPGGRRFGPRPAPAPDGGPTRRVPAAAAVEDQTFRHSVAEARNLPELTMDTILAPIDV